MKLKLEKMVILSQLICIKIKLIRTVTRGIYWVKLVLNIQIWPKLFQRVRDESHRFAINYHSSLRAKSQTKNILEEIEGVGPKTRAKLLRKFGSLKKIRETSETEIAQIIGEKNAQNVKEFLKNQA